MGIEGIQKQYKTLVLILSSGVRVHLDLTDKIDFTVSLIEPSPVEAVLCLKDPQPVHFNKAFARNYQNPHFVVIKYKQVRREIEVFCARVKIGESAELLVVTVQHL